MITPFTLNGYYEYALKGDSQKTGMAVEIQLVDELLMVVILYLEQLYNNEPCSKYAVR